MGNVSIVLWGLLLECNTLYNFSSYFNHCCRVLQSGCGRDQLFVYIVLPSIRAFLFCDSMDSGKERTQENCTKNKYILYNHSSQVLDLIRRFASNAWRVAENNIRTFRNIWNLSNLCWSNICSYRRSKSFCQIQSDREIEVFVLGSTICVASSWFGPKERTIATSIGFTLNTVGMGVGYLINPEVTSGKLVNHATLTIHRGR